MSETVQKKAEKKSHSKNELPTQEPWAAIRSFKEAAGRRFSVGAGCLAPLNAAEKGDAEDTARSDGTVNDC